MAKISDIRRRNLMRLRVYCENEYYKRLGSKKPAYTNVMFGEMIGITAVEYAQLKNHKIKPFFNESYARKIEKQMELELGWFDVNRDSVKFEAIRANFDLFYKGVVAYNEFTNTSSIKITDDKKQLHVIKNLFLFLNDQTDVNKVEVTEADFFEFMK